jgi:sortase family protein
VVSLVVGLVLTIGAPLWWVTQDDPAALSAVDPGAVSRLARAPAPGPDPESVRRRAGSGAVDVPADIPVSRPGGARLHPPAGSPPVELRIPSLAVDAPVVATGVAEDGQLAIPADISRVGWYRWGPKPGARAGSVVLVSHLDSASQPGLGALAYLRTVEAGALVAVTTRDGREWRYRVVGRQAIAKGRLPLEDIFSSTGQPRLTLMTCGGSFDPATRSYDDTVVVSAVPVP